MTNQSYILAMMGSAATPAAEVRFSDTDTKERVISRAKDMSTRVGDVYYRFQLFWENDEEGSDVMIARWDVRRESVIVEPKDR